MGKRLKHRLPRLLRAATVIAWTLQGLLTPWLEVPVYAANPDTSQLGVMPISLKPPAAVADLMASVNQTVPAQAVLSWTAPQGNAGGTPIPNQTVASYTVRYATFSVDSLGGDTTSWWNSPGTVSTTLQPPSYNPKTPGNLEVYVWASLSPGTTLYFALKSTSLGGVLSPIDTHASTAGQQAQALIPGALNAPSSFNGIALSSTSIQWSWSLVPGASQYLIYSDPANTLLQTLSDPTSSWIETSLTPNTAYSRKATATNGTQTSGYSPVGSRYTLAAVPGTPSVTGVTDTTISLSWTANSNSAGTNYGIERSPDGLIFSQVSLSTGTSFQDTGLTANTTYYYRLRAQNGDSIWTAYTAVVSAYTNSFSTPLRPSGILGTILPNGQFVLSWHAVTLDVNGQPISIDHYRVDRYNLIQGTVTYSAVVPAGLTSYSEPANGQINFYTVTAVTAGGDTSAPSDYVDSSPQANRYALASDDSTTRVVIPHDVAIELLAENNTYGQDLEVRFTRRSQDEVNTTLRSYHIGAYRAVAGDEIPYFSFSQPIISIQLGTGSVIGGSLSQNSVAALQNIQKTSAGSIAQIIAIYWFNGMQYVRVSDPVLTSDQALAVTVRSLGTYQIRAVTLPTKFQLTQGSPYPRVITPNGAENHRVFFFFDNPNGDAVTGAIFDIRGAKVRDLQVNSMSPTPNALVWDGRDGQGSVVPSGVYLYKISTTDGAVTGTVVVAR